RTLEGSWTVHDARSGEGSIWGLTGIRAEGAPGASAAIEFCKGCPPSETPGTLSLHFLEAPDMGTLQVLIDGQLVATLPESGALPETARARTLSFPVRGEAHRIEV